MNKLKFKKLTLFELLIMAAKKFRELFFKTKPNFFASFLSLFLIYKPIKFDKIPPEL